jgi:phosphoribosylaminoimidazole (AIR) synthetase
MISAITEDHESGSLRMKDVEFAIFNHENMPIFMNSDGVGTKIEIAERTKHHTNMHDLFAMLMDDAIKKAAEVKVLSAVYESREKKVLLESLLRNSGKKLAKQTGITFTMQAEKLGERVNGYGDEPYNLGGTCVSLIDEKALANPPVPKPGNYIVVIRNKDNPTFRSNGITKVREGLKQIYGEEWHMQKFNDHRVGKLAGAPSTVFYPVFRELWGRKFATSFSHMSGGAYEGKFARVFAKYGLYAEISDLFEPPALMQKLVEHYKLAPEEAYRIWNMGNEGYITTARLNDAVGVLRRYGLEGKSVGVVTAAHDKTGLTIKLKDAEIYYPGK